MHFARIFQIAPLIGLLFGAHLWPARAAQAPARAEPNIVLILADDLGYGDVKCFNPGGKIATPNLDRLAAEGMIFTDAHSSAAVCTPTRYGLLTGRYNWRSRLKSGVQGGMSPPLIEPGRLTIASFLQQQGYRTACIGKWHLGLDWTRHPGAEPFGDNIEKGADGWRVDFSKPITRGPNDFGFDLFFGIAASLDMIPYTFIENRHVTALPNMDKSFPFIPGRTNRMSRHGPGASFFQATNVLPVLMHRARMFVENHLEARPNQPFFLYLPLASPHTPVAPTDEWVGRSGLNAYADFVMQTDAEVGMLLDRLEGLGLTKNSLVIFTSDNGCSPDARIDELLERGHRPSAQFRGAKADIFEGGHRVPLIVRWPGRIAPGSTSAQLVTLNDWFATCAEMLGQSLAAGTAEDSISFLHALEGRSSAKARKTLVNHSINGTYAIRDREWKLIFAPDSGGWSNPRPNTPAARSLPSVQLYNLATDPGETNNLRNARPEIVQRLTRLLEETIDNPARTNTTPVATPKAKG